MAVRPSHALFLFFWLASMGWLITAKIVPVVVGGDPPDYRSRLADTSAPPDSWRVKWNGETIGFAASCVTPRVDGAVDLRSVVHIEQVSLDSILGELLGPASTLVRPWLTGRGQWDVELLVATRLSYDQHQQLTGIRSVLDLGQVENVVTVEGDVTSEGRLELMVRLASTAAAAGLADGSVLRQTVQLPREALVSDSLSPRPELNHLRLGQSWTVPVYRAFPPNQPVQVVEAAVERHEIILWNGRDVETLLVVYRADSGAGIQSTRGPLGREWVRADGTILRQEVALAGMRIEFERLDEGTAEPRRELLDEAAHPRLWRRPGDD